jgi:hypothetical protein
MKTKLFDENLIGQPGLSKYIDPNLTWCRDIEDYDSAIYIDRLCFISEIDKSKKNYAWIIEPPIINGENYNNIVNNKENFKYIFTHIRNLLERADNAVYIPHGSTWLKDDEIQMYDKSKLVSSIFSYKDWNSYHRMRHRVWDRLKNDNRVEFFGSGCDKPIDFKIDALKDFKFSIVIENSIEDLYFTEKLLDCFLTGTIPIYVGSKKITEFFDENGVIFFEGDEDLPEILDKLSDELYNSKRESILNNFEVAKNFIHPEKLINEFIENNV